jgi:hypothetical protein
MAVLWNTTMTSLLGIAAAHGASNPLASLPHRYSAVTFAKNIQHSTMLPSCEHHPFIHDREGLPRCPLQNTMMPDLAKVTDTPVSIVTRHVLVSYLHLGH